MHTSIEKKTVTAPLQRPSVRQRLRRMWQPHNGLFWLMLLFNGFSSGMAGYLHWVQPGGWWLLLLTLLALANAAAGMVLLVWLWRRT